MSLNWSPIEGYENVESIVYYDFPRWFYCHPAGKLDELYLATHQGIAEDGQGNETGYDFLLLPITEQDKEHIADLMKAGEYILTSYLHLSREDRIIFAYEWFGTPATFEEKTVGQTRAWLKEEVETEKENT